MTRPHEPSPPAGSAWTEEDRRLRATMADELPLQRLRVRDSEAVPQADPELAEGPASTTRIMVYAIAALLIVGVVLYGMTQNHTNTAATPPAASTASNSSTSATPPRKPNTQPGTTTGAAPAHPVAATPDAPH